MIVRLLCVLGMSAIGCFAAGSLWPTCKNVIAIPGNGHDRTDADCAVCNLGAYAHYPCDDPGLCYCSGTLIPAKYVLPYTYCDKAVSVPMNSHGVTDAQCANCALAKNRHYPCTPLNSLCECAPCHNASAPCSGATPVPTATPVPATQAPGTAAPATQSPATAAPATQVPTTRAPTPVPTAVPRTPVPRTPVPRTPVPPTPAPTAVPPTLSLPKPSATQRQSTKFRSLRLPTTPTVPMLPHCRRRPLPAANAPITKYSATASASTWRSPAAML